jgi:asparagine synthase (glutamine-hydrolysing)
MCGIAGLYGFRNDSLIKKISRDLQHRGPDGEGIYADDQVTLLNRRLAIIDIEGGSQPIYNEDKSVAVVYNGEIYNFRELKEQLTRKGHRFLTNSDTEVIVHGYEEWGTDCFDKFNAMFAIALWDKNKKRLILARDHFGIKPLYYSVLKKKESDSLKVIFSSEIKPILGSGLVAKEPNGRIIYRYLMFRIHDNEEETFFKGIKRLMPGQLLTIEENEIKSLTFTNLRKELMRLKAKPYDNEKVMKFKDELIKAIKYRLIADVPVGTCLSGGLDSSTVVAIVNSLFSDEVKEARSIGQVQNTFSAVFPGSKNDEEKYINALIDGIEKIKSHKVYPKPEEFFTDLEDFVRTQEEPTISTGPYAQYKVMEEAARNVKVLLDGQGADEMMAGYLPYYFVYLRQLLTERKYPKLIKETLSSFDVVSQYFIYKFQSKIGLKQEIVVETLLNDKFKEKYIDEKFHIVSDNLKKRLIEDVFENSLPSLLRYEDRNSMRFSIEGRVPFLDFNLIRYIFSLSDEAIISRGWNKNILRQTVNRLLPEIIAKRRNKIGFTTPEHEWFMRMKNRIYSVFLSEQFAKRPYFNQNEVLKAFQKFIEGKNDDTMLFWRMLNLEIWLRTFFDPPPSQTRVPAEGQPNLGKKITITVDGNTYQRYPIKTSLVKRGDDIKEIVLKHILSFISRTKDKEYFNKPWFIVISEKIVAISQGRSYFIWEIKPTLWANVLSRYVRRTPYGIGLGSPWTMQLAINEVGLIRILFAAIASILTKPFGIKGVFYHLAGRQAAAIDGPTEYSLYPSNVSAKLGPKEPQKTAEDINQYIKSNLSKEAASEFKGVAIIDANDLGQNVLGNSTSIPSQIIERVFSDNPMGQADEQTPLVTVISS